MKRALFYKRKNKGFTLIELLAVIAVLGIIMAIIIPNVTKTIDKARRRTAENSIRGLMRAIDITQKDYAMEESLDTLIFTFEEGNEESNKDNLKLSYTGKRPKKGQIIIDEKGLISLAIYDGKFCFIKRFADDDIDIKEGAGQNECTPLESFGPNDEFIPEGYVLASDSDFGGTKDGEFIYYGNDDYIVMPYTIKGINVTSYYGMFEEATIKGIASYNPDITDMRYMFRDSRSDILDLSRFFAPPMANLSYMFSYSRALQLDLTGLSICPTQNIDNMFFNSFATVGYARTQEDADKLNNSTNKPQGLTFTVKQ